MTPEEAKKVNEEAIEAARIKQAKEKGPITFAELEDTVKKWMLIEDEGVIKYICAAYVANHRPGDPVWSFLVGASGGGKTELLNGLIGLDDTYAISNLTPQTFLSGMPGKADASLLPKINGKIVIFKDWTSIIAMNKDARSEIMGQLREIFDGHMRKPFGNNKIAEWNGRIGIIAGVTPVIDLTQQMHASLGERFIQYRIKMPDRKKVAKISLNNTGKQDEMRDEIKEGFLRFFMGLDMKIEAPKLSDEIQDEIIKVANLATMARSGVIREFSFKKEVIFVPAVEMPTRITQQLKALADSYYVVNGGEFMEKDMDSLYKVALDSIPQTNRMVMLEMARKDNQTTANMATSLGYPTAPIHMYLENLAMLGVCDRIKGGSADTWVIKEEFKEILEKYEEIMPIENEEEDQEALLQEAEELMAEEGNGQDGSLGI